MNQTITISQMDIAREMQNRMKKEQADKVRNYKTLNRLAKKGQILFTGSSLMEQFPIQELALPLGLSHLVYNRGIGGTTTDDFLREIDTVLLDLMPSKVFINIGTNDMTDRVYGDKWLDHLMENYEKILQIAKEKLPDTDFYLMAYYPTNQHLPDAPEWSKDMLKERSKENIAACNQRVATLAKNTAITILTATTVSPTKMASREPNFPLTACTCMPKPMRLFSRM